MTYKGHVRNGAIVVDEPISLPEGTVVMIEALEVKSSEDQPLIPTLAERLSSVIGKANDLPANWSENHDLYLRKAYDR